MAGLGQCPFGPRWPNITFCGSIIICFVFQTDHCIICVRCFQPSDKLSAHFCCISTRRQKLDGPPMSAIMMQQGSTRADISATTLSSSSKFMSRSNSVSESDCVACSTSSLHSTDSTTAQTPSCSPQPPKCTPHFPFGMFDS